MNIANKLTVLRILMTPVFMLVLLIDAIPYNVAIALVVFILASVTDFLDGYLARSRNMVTEFGKFLDPIADKIIVMAALVIFAGFGWIQSWTVVVILIRDSIVSAVRLAAVESEDRVVMPARMAGKVKTMVTMLTVCIIMGLWILADLGWLFFEGKPITVAASDVIKPVSNVLMYVCTALTVFSGGQYAYDARKILKKTLSDN